MGELTIVANDTATGVKVDVVLGARFERRGSSIIPARLGVARRMGQVEGEDQFPEVVQAIENPIFARHIVHSLPPGLRLGGSYRGQ